MTTTAASGTIVIGLTGRILQPIYGEGDNILRYFKVGNFYFKLEKYKGNYLLTISDTITFDKPDKLILSLAEAYERIAECAEISEEDYKG